MRMKLPASAAIGAAFMAAPAFAQEAEPGRRPPTSLQAWIREGNRDAARLRARIPCQVQHLLRLDGAQRLGQSLRQPTMRRGGPREEQPRQEPRKPPRREREADPDSPFAALAALKQQLEKGSGDR